MYVYAYICICMHKFIHMYIYIYMYVCISTRISSTPTCLYEYAADLAHFLAQSGQLPMHLAVANQAGPEVVVLLLQAYPDAASKADEVGCEGHMERCVHSVFMCASCMRTCFWFMFIYAYKYTYMNIHIYTYIYIYIYVCTYIHIHIYIYIYAYLCIQIYMCVSFNQ